MSGAGADKTRRPHERHLACAFVLFLILGGPVPVEALDTTVDLRDSQQRTREGFSSYLRRGAITLRHSARLRQPWVLDMNLSVLQERSGSRVEGLELTSLKRAYQPVANLSYQTKPLAGGLRANWLVREASGFTALAPLVTRTRLGGWLNAEPTRSTRLSSLLTYIQSHDDFVVGPDQRQTGFTSFLRAEQSLGNSFKFDYRLTGTSTDLVTREIYRTQWTHDFDLRGSPLLAGGRLTTYFRARSRLFSQRVETGTTDEVSLYRRPISGGVILDSTPETHDPLEDQGETVPGLADGDLETPTSINLGDSAPVVVEFGGDYRNISYDFGNAVAFASANLYVDTRLASPELFAWRLFTTDDPDARVWEEVDADRAVVRYQEWGAVLQGWEVTFTADVSARFFKMVNVKFGTTADDIFVTELEVYGRETGEVVGVTRGGTWNYGEARFNLQATSRLQVGYEGRVSDRAFDEDAQNFDKTQHAVLSRYALGPHALYARVDVLREQGTSRRNANIETYQVSLTRDRQLRLSGALSWDRTVDEGGGRERTTDAVSILTNLRAAPRLRIRQTLSEAQHRDAVLDLNTRSFIMVNRIEGAPVKSLWIDIDWSERWVTENTGVGYDRFTGTRLDVFWTPAPLINLGSRTRYQKRIDEVWNSRQSISWTPMPGGAVTTILTGDVFYDSRFRTWEQSARMHLKWKVRPGMLAEGSVELRRFRFEGLTTTPVSTYFHLSWTL